MSSDKQKIEERVSLRADQIFEIVRRDGLEELARPVASLFWSAVAAGLAIGFSVIAEAALTARLPADMPGHGLVADLGYTIGFILVIMGRLQLFTENTITPVLPIMNAPSAANFSRLTRLWIVVLFGNVLGATVFAAFMMLTPAISAEMQDAIIKMSLHAAEGGFWDVLVRGVGAGFLIAVLVWMLANMTTGELLTVFLVTYVIAAAEFSHVIAGSVEMAALMITGTFDAYQAIVGFWLPALIGNIIGGTALFAVLAYAQIKDEL